MQQARDGNYTNKSNPAAESVNDIEAYRTELSRAQANGVPQDHINEIKKELQIELEFLRRTDPAYYEQVQRGDYTLRPEDKQKIPERARSRPERSP